MPYVLPPRIVDQHLVATLLVLHAANARRAAVHLRTQRPGVSFDSIHLNFAFPSLQILFLYFKIVGSTVFAFLERSN